MPEVNEAHRPPAIIRWAAVGLADVAFLVRCRRLVCTLLPLAMAKDSPSALAGEGGDCRRFPEPKMSRSWYREVPMEVIVKAPTRSSVDELPIRVREAAIFLGVSPQTVYLWVERNQIPHLRVMRRNIRF